MGHLYHIIRVAVGMVCLNGYRDSDTPAEFLLQQEVVQRLWLYGCGGAPLSSAHGSVAMKQWFIENLNVQEVVMHALQRYIVHLLESMPAVLHIISHFYETAASACFPQFCNHVKRTSKHLFEFLNASPDNFDALSSFVCPIYEGTKLPKQICEANLMRMRDLDNALLGVQQCNNVHGLSSELFLVINYALHVRRVPADVLMHHLVPSNPADVDLWHSYITPLVSAALQAKKPDALKMLEPL